METKNPQSQSTKQRPVARVLFLLLLLVATWFSMQVKAPAERWHRPYEHEFQVARENWERSCSAWNRRQYLIAMDARTLVWRERLSAEFQLDPKLIEVAGPLNALEVWSAPAELQAYLEDYPVAQRAELDLQDEWEIRESRAQLRVIALELAEAMQPARILDEDWLYVSARTPLEPLDLDGAREAKQAIRGGLHWLNMPLRPEPNVMLNAMSRE